MTQTEADVIRRAEPADAAEIARLAGELGYPTSPDQMVNRLEPLLADPDHCLLVAVRAGGLAGWVHVGRRRSVETGERAELMGLVVDAGARRSGLGRRLVEEAERWAAGQGLKEIVVRSNVARAESHPFYDGAGYARVKTQHAYAKTLAEAETP